MRNQMTEQDKYYHFEYETMTAARQKQVDAAFKSLMKSLKESSLVCAKDDRAESLVAAIARYVIASGNEF
jgi:hypothetical protein